MTEKCVNSLSHMVNLMINVFYLISDHHVRRRRVPRVRRRVQRPPPGDRRAVGHDGRDDQGEQQEAEGRGGQVEDVKMNSSIRVTLPGYSMRFG